MRMSRSKVARQDAVEHGRNTTNDDVLDVMFVKVREHVLKLVEHLVCDPRYSD